MERALALDPEPGRGSCRPGLDPERTTTGTGRARTPPSSEPSNSSPETPRSCGARRGLAGTLGRFDEAIDLGRRAVRARPAERVSHLNLGINALRAGRLDEAEAALRKALELNPEYPAGHLVLGRVFLAPSKPEAALQEMEQEKDPSGAARVGARLSRPRPEEGGGRALGRASGEGRKDWPSRSPRSTPSAARRIRRSSGSSGPTPRGTAASPR